MAFARARPNSFVPVKTWMPSRRKTFSISIAGVRVKFLQNVFAALDERDLDAEPREKLRELARNRAAAENDQRLGSRFSASASSLVMKPTSFSCGNGAGATREPVAMTKCLAVSFLAVAQLPSRVRVQKPGVGADEFEFAGVELLRRGNRQNL